MDQREILKERAKVLNEVFKDIAKDDWSKVNDCQEYGFMDAALMEMLNSMSAIFRAQHEFINKKIST